MPISAKPKSDRAQPDIDVESLINKGGSVPADSAPQNVDKAKNVQLRLFPSKIAEIDALCAQRRVKISRHHWFMEAIEEKLEREQGEEGHFGST